MFLTGCDTAHVPSDCKASYETERSRTFLEVAVAGCEAQSILVVGATRPQVRASPIQDCYPRRSGERVNRESVRATARKRSFPSWMRFFSSGTMGGRLPDLSTPTKARTWLCKMLSGHCKGYLESMPLKPYLIRFLAALRRTTFQASQTDQARRTSLRVS